MFITIKKIALCTLLVGSAAWAEVDDHAVKVNWSYLDDTGPAKWGTLNPDFALCEEGKSQSPINIPSDTKKTSNALTIHYHPEPMQIVDDSTTEVTLGKKQYVINDGHGIQLNFPLHRSKETITYHGKTYHLIQFHLHTPSENKLNGKSYPLEIHFVHQGEEGSIVVIGVFVHVGDENATLQKLIDHLPEKKGEVVQVKGVQINPVNLLPPKRDYYSFMGSLTTPPCAEGVQWIVMKDTIDASKEQINKLIDEAGGKNARPTQALHDREILLSE